MKYINLLPPELQPKSAGMQRRTKPFPKVLLGCLIVPVLLALVSFFAVKGILYRYERGISSLTSQEFPAANTEVPVVTARPIKRRRAVLKKRPQPPPEKTVSAITNLEPQTHQSNTVRKKGDGYTLHVESFVTKDKAKALMQKMMEQKLEPYQQSKQIKKRINTIYVSQSSTMEEAMEMTRRLGVYGYEAFIKIRPRGANWVGIKGFAGKAKTQELAKRLSSLGYSSNIVPEQVSLTIYQVNLGPYKEYRQAKATQNRLEELGYRFTSIIRER